MYIFSRLSIDNQLLPHDNGDNAFHSSFAEVFRQCLGGKMICMHRLLWSHVQIRIADDRFEGDSDVDSYDDIIDRSACLIFCLCVDVLSFTWFISYT